MYILGFFMMAVVWVVNTPVADMYSRPSAGSDLVSQALFATPVDRLGESGDWARIRTPDNYEGWTREANLHPAPGGYPAKGRSAWVNNLFAHLYHEPDVTKRTPLLRLPYDARLEIAEEPPENERRWLRVRLPDSREAWVQRGDLRFDDEAVSVGEAILSARRFVGLPYLWGGTSTFGFDCSGFTQLLLRRRGIVIPRDAGPQARWSEMTEISRAALAAGDLLYFGESPEKITHTGLYIGDGEFIHATAYKNPVVQVSRLDDPHWSSLLVACRRPPGAAR